jgi:hypothetical protein
MTNSLHSPEISEQSISDSEYYQQIELPIKLDTKCDSKISAIHEQLLNCIERLDKQQEFLGYLSQGNIEVLMAVNQQGVSSSTEDIEAVKQKVNAIDQGMMKIYHYLKEDIQGKELKAGQQNLQKAIAPITPLLLEANQKKTTHNVGFLDWKQIATIITATAVISSLCSLAVFQVASNLKTDQKTPIFTEKPLKPKIKKTPQ